MHKLCDVAGYQAPAIARTKTPEQILAERMAQVAADYARLADELAAINQSRFKAAS